MLWLFYSVLELDHDRMVFVLRLTLIPILILLSLLTYIFRTISLDTSYFFGVYYKSSPILEFLFQIFTVFTLLFTNRLLGYNLRSVSGRPVGCKHIPYRVFSDMSGVSCRYKTRTEILEGTHVLYHVHSAG